MKLSYYSAILFFLFTFFIYSCSGDKAKQTVKNIIADEQSSDENLTASNEDNLIGGWEKLVMKDVKEDGKEVSYSLPLPESWNVFKDPGEPHFITGPNNLKIIVAFSNKYGYSHDPYMIQTLRQNGVEIQPLPDENQLFDKYILPGLQEMGIAMINYEELPEVDAPMRWYAENLFNPYNARVTAKSYGIDGIDSKGITGYLITVLRADEDSNMTSWYLQHFIMEADPQFLDAAKKTFVFALGNIRFNLDLLMRQNQIEAQRHNQNWAVFNNRMKANQLAFEQRQRDHINRVNGINEEMMNRYNSTDMTNERIHNRTIDAIRGEENVYNPNTGEMHKVEQGYNQYWMNNDGVYLATESPTYDPNLDENLNNMRWDGLQKVVN